MLNTMLILMKKILNLELVIIKKFQNIKTFFTKEYTPNWLAKVFAISKIKIAVPWTYVINDLNGGDIVETFYEKQN